MDEFDDFGNGFFWASILNIEFSIESGTYKFEKIEDDNEYELFHFVLESEDDYENYGVYITDGILSETCPKIYFDKLIH